MDDKKIVAVIQLDGKGNAFDITDGYEGKPVMEYVFNEVPPNIPVRNRILRWIKAKLAAFRLT